MPSDQVLISETDVFSDAFEVLDRVKDGDHVVVCDLTDNLDGYPQDHLILSGLNPYTGVVAAYAVVIPYADYLRLTRGIPQNQAPLGDSPGMTGDHRKSL